MQIRFAIETIQSLDIPESEKEKILSGNARKILRLP
jgi:predicted TIM-barrel fold metal-dependent hydrolase